MKTGDLFEKHLDGFVEDMLTEFEKKFLRIIDLQSVRIVDETAGKYVAEYNSEKYNVSKEEGLEKFKDAFVFQKIRESEYKGAGLDNAHQRSLNDVILYALKFYDLESQQEFFAYARNLFKEHRQSDTAEDIRGLNKIEIELTDGLGIQSWKRYGLIPVRNQHTDFFKGGYKQPFILRTDIGDIKTQLVSAPKGTKKGTYAGNYITQGIQPWFRAHSELQVGDFLIIEKLDKELNGLDLYTLGIRKR